jgi:hypothetical protein
MTQDIRIIRIATQGPAGPPGSGGGGSGSTWYQGAGAPASGTGVDGDFYLNTANGDVYQKAAGAWGAAVGNIAGPQGPQGATGAQGPQGVTGPTGPAGPQGNDGLQGPQGATGPQGNDGPQGPQGATGPQGNDGAQGPQGATGPQGPQGDPGPLVADVTTEDVIGTSYTLVAADLGKRKRTTNAAAVAVTLPKTLEQGFSVLFCQAAAGQITFAAETGGTLNNRAGDSKTAGQWSEVSLTVDSNADGISAAWVLSGDTAP